jgi:hypothetical protein
MYGVASLLVRWRVLCIFVCGVKIDSGLSLDINGRSIETWASRLELGA